MTLEELIKWLGDKRVHLSSDPNLTLKFPYHPKDFEERVYMTGKPTGLWWGCNGEWLEWCSSEMPEWIKPYVYEVTPPERLLKVTTFEEYEAFCDRYVPKGYMLRWDRMPNWGTIAESYSAIEISPYRHERRLEDVWYYGWDCASGCAWRDAKVKLIAVREGEGFKIVGG